MSKHDPTAKNAVNPNFNDNISNNGLGVVKMSTITSIICLFDTTHTSTSDRIQTKPMTETFNKKIQDKETGFPTTDLHSRGHYQHYYGLADNYTGYSI
jgi:hypothetical protein